MILMHEAVRSCNFVTIHIRFECLFLLFQENSSLQQMGNSGLLDLFNGSESKNNRDKKSDQGKKGESRYFYRGKF